MGIQYFLFSFNYWIPDQAGNDSKNCIVNPEIIYINLIFSLQLRSITVYSLPVLFYPYVNSLRNYHIEIARLEDLERATSPSRKTGGILAA